MKHRSTSDVARLVGVSKKTILRWLWEGKVPEPKHLTGGGQDVRVWNARDIAKAAQYKEANYRKGRGRKKKAE
jgi:predicted DNA-binding transcriptional regulator AlpA